MDVSECAEEDEPRLGYFVYWTAVTKIAKSENILCSASIAKRLHLLLSYVETSIVFTPPKPFKIDYRVKTSELVRKVLTGVK